ncbi:MAG: ABC transporter permease [Candidatus Omnitrophota bacterium]
MSIEYWIAWRYLVTKRKEKFLGLISVIAILGVVVGVAALMVVTAVMSGFTQDLRDKIIGNSSHLIISDDSGIENSQLIISQIKSLPHVEGVSPFVAGQALIRQGDKILGVKIRGIDPGTVAQVGKIDSYLVSGELAQLDYEGVIIGKELAMSLGLDVGGGLSLQMSARKIHRLTVKGIFSSGMYEYDTELIFLHVDKVKEMFGLSNITGIAIKLDKIELVPVIKDKIQRLIGYSYIIRSWMELNANFFAALKLEKITMFIILCLIILVAAFNIISTLIVLVVEKTKDIGILKAIGMSRRRIQGIFIFEGLAIGFIGTGLGVGVGWLLCFLLKRYKFVKLPADIYYLDHLPVSLSFWPDVGLIVVAAVLITVLSTIYPAMRAGRLKPVDALRYE